MIDPLRDEAWWLVFHSALMGAASSPHSAETMVAHAGRIADAAVDELRRRVAVVEAEADKGES